MQESKGVNSIEHYGYVQVEFVCACDWAWVWTVAVDADGIDADLIRWV